MIRPFALLFAVLVLLLAAGCDKTEEITPLVVPAAYDTTTYKAATVSEYRLRSQLALLVAEAKKGRAGTAVDSVVLRNLFEANGAQSLKAATSSYYAGLMFSYFKALSDASGGTFNPQSAPYGQGGVYGSGSAAYLFDESGLEMEQQIEKGLFAAMFFNRASLLMQGTVKDTTVDKLVALFGANPVFASNDTASKGKDEYAAKYAERRSPKTDANSFYAVAKRSLITAQAAAKAGADYQNELDGALLTFRQSWEKANAATIINYSYAVQDGLTKTSPTADDLAKALHAYGEIVGFVRGWKTIPQAHKIATDAQLDELLVLLKAPDGAAPQPYLFVTDSFNTVGNFQTLITRLKEIYGFTDAQLLDFKNTY